MKTKTLKIGIIGNGFVGNAVLRGFSEHSSLDTELFVYDKDPAKSIHTFADVLKCDAIFVCVPSPMNLEDGSCDTSILEEVMSQLDTLNCTIISKTTAPPQCYSKLADKHLNLVFSPEFLTAANAANDYANSNHIIVAGRSAAHMAFAASMIRKSIRNREAKTIECTIEEAVLVKYAINSFLATKVIFMNELKSLANAVGADYETVARLMTHDDRIGRSHMMVPGPDGAYGFGGACFPKDTSAMKSFAEAAGVNVEVLEAAINKNIRIKLAAS